MELRNTENRQRSFNIWIMRVPEKENWSKGPEQIPKTVIEIFMDFLKNVNAYWEGILFDIHQQQDIFQ